MSFAGNLTAASESYSSKVVASQLLAASNAFPIKATAGVVRSVIVGTTAAAARYIYVYNKATAPVGTDVPVAVITIPAAPTPSQPIPLNIACSAGIYLTISSSVGLVGSLTSILGLNEVVVNVVHS